MRRFFKEQLVFSAEISSHDESVINDKLAGEAYGTMVYYIKVFMAHFSMKITVHTLKKAVHVEASVMYLHI